MWLILTNKHGKKVRINMNLIESYSEINEDNYPDCKDYYGMTALVYINMDNNKGIPYIVKETPEQIDFALNNTSSLTVKDVEYLVKYFM